MCAACDRSYWSCWVCKAIIEILHICLKRLIFQAIDRRLLIEAYVHPKYLYAITEYADNDTQRVRFVFVYN